MDFTGAIDESQPYCVYSHHIDGSLFYVGSGAFPRAFESGHARRNEGWINFVRQAAGYPYVNVRIHHRCTSRSEARRVEYDLIRKYRPIANQTGAPSEWTIADIDGQQTATDADFGTLILMLPERVTFGTSRIASRVTGISESAISNSIAGRYPIVGGRSFRRIPRPVTNDMDELRRIISAAEE